MWALQVVEEIILRIQRCLSIVQYLSFGDKPSQQKAVNLKIHIYTLIDPQIYLVITAVPPLSGSGMKPM